MFITLDVLEKFDACNHHLDTFQRLFPDGVEVTPEACVKHASDFDWPWAADHLLDRVGHEEFHAFASSTAEDSANQRYRTDAHEEYRRYLREVEAWRNWRQREQVAEPEVGDRYREITDRHERNDQAIYARFDLAQAQMFASLADRYPSSNLKRIAAGEGIDWDEVW